MRPDKIYLGIGPMSGDEPNRRYLYAEWYENPKHLVENIAYIRKDALLEWAKETYLNENASAIRKVCYKQLIDKLNSM